MRKFLAVIEVCFIIFSAGRTFAAPVLNVPLSGGFFNSEYTAGSGAETAYFVVDFGGKPGGGGIHGYTYHWDGTQTADNAMLSIDAAGSLDMQYIDFGSPGEPNLQITKLTDPPDSDEPDFNTDGRFWDYFLGTRSDKTVGWTESLYGISGRDFNTGEVVQMLADGGFYGFYASADSTPPGLPTVGLKHGDLNLDGVVDAADIQAMEAALANVSAFQNGGNSQQAVLTAAEMLAIGDVNGDGRITNADLQALLVNLTGGGIATQSVPEPAAWLLMFLAAACLLSMFARADDRCRAK